MCLDFLKENAKDVFIRNIMHELKTPITKGRFLVELENNQQIKLNYKQFSKTQENLYNII